MRFLLCKTHNIFIIIYWSSFKFNLFWRSGLSQPEIVQKRFRWVWSLTNRTVKFIEEKNVMIKGTGSANARKMAFNGNIVNQQNFVAVRFPWQLPVHLGGEKQCGVKLKILFYGNNVVMGTLNTCWRLKVWYASHWGTRPPPSTGRCSVGKYSKLILKQDKYASGFYWVRVCRRSKLNNTRILH